MEMEMNGKFHSLVFYTSLGIFSQVSWYNINISITLFKANN